MRSRYYLVVGIAIFVAFEARLALCHGGGSCSCSVRKTTTWYIIIFCFLVFGRSLNGSVPVGADAASLQLRAPDSALISGAVDDCCCSVEVVDDVNPKIRPILEELVKTTYFRHYKVRIADWINFQLPFPTQNLPLTSAGPAAQFMEKVQNISRRWSVYV